MGKGPKCGSQRGKVAKNLRSGGRKKRFKNDNSEAQKAYHAKIAARRAKKLKKR
jgi:hypothetical protein